MASTDSSSPAAPSADPRTLQTGMILGIVLVSYFMIVLDNSIIFTGLPQIQAGLGLSDAGLAWAQNAYTLVFGGLLLLGARMGDLLGRRRVFIVGLVLFGLASLLVGIAQSQAWIIAARAFQGVGAAIVAPSSLALITAVFPAGPERTRATAAYGTTAGLGASLGLVVGGALADAISWRAGFFINVPIAAVMVVMALRYLPGFQTVLGRFDLIGALTSTVGMGALAYGIIPGRGTRVDGPADDDADAARPGGPGRVRAERVAGPAADHAAAAVREPPALRRGRGPAALRGDDDRVLLLHHAVLPRRVRVDAAAGGAGVPADDDPPVRLLPGWSPG